MKTITYYTIAIFVLIMGFTVVSCAPEESEENNGYYTVKEYAALQEALNIPNYEIDYTIKLPAHVGGPATPISNDLSLLGRVLFYDTNLSKNGTVSCASCHHQEVAFADKNGHSTGFDGVVTPRNSLALGATLGFEISYDPNSIQNFNGEPQTQSVGFLWDDRAKDISEQSKIAFTDKVEMGMDNMAEVIERVKKQPYYEVLFKKAFKNDLILEWQVLKAMEGFVNSLASTHTRFDEGMNRVHDPQKDFHNFSPMENLGKKLYLDNCSSCHGTRMVGLLEARANNGLDYDYSDQGRYEFTNRGQDLAIFKVPMLRNIALTAPYMHDGRFATLEEVVEHYNSGVKSHPNLHHNLRDKNNYSQAKRLNLTDEEKQALVAFLHTLTDYQLTSDPRFSNPFK